MPFPLSKSGSFRVEVQGPAELHVPVVEAELLDWLADKKARSVTHADRVITFKAGAFRFVLNWNILVQVGSGEIWLASKGGEVEISYKLRFTEMFLIVTALSLLGLESLGTSENLGEVDLFIEFLIVWPLLFVPNYLIAIFRIPNALKNLVRRATGGTVV